ncbi:MAG: DUF2628 domain-containing protein [Pseudomonadota bacterium]
MASYRVFELEDASDEKKATGDDLTVVYDGFSILALALPALYLLWHRLWLGLLLYIFVSALVIMAGQAIDPAIPFFLNLLVGLFLAFEAATFRADKLTQTGWREVDHVVAANSMEAEARALDRHLQRQKQKTIDRPMTEARPETPLRATASYKKQPPVIGSFPVRPRPAGRRP